MSDTANTENWPAPGHEPDLDAEGLATWRELTAKVKATAERYGWSRSEVCRRAAIPSATFWQWYNGDYKGVIANINQRVEKFLASVEELTIAAARIPVAPAFVATPTASQLIDTLLYAQMMPEMVVVTLGAGMGKSITCETFCATRPHAFMVTMRPSTASVHNMLRELCETFDIRERDPAKLDRAIGAKLRRNGRNTLLIIDEAQNLKDEAVNQLRSYLDAYGVGIALVGNEELYKRFDGKAPTPAYAQLHRRIGMRLRRLHPLAEDISGLIDAWGVEDDAIRRLLTVVGKKPGALGQIDKTLKLAGMYAAGNQRELTVADVKAAAENRGLGEV